MRFFQSSEAEMVTKTSSGLNSSMGSRDRSLSMINLSATGVEPIPRNPFGVEDSSDDPADSKVPTRTEHFHKSTYQTQPNSNFFKKI